jgi:hypothetical protein
LAELKEIIIFLDGNNFQMELNVGEGGKYIRDANKKFCMKRLQCDYEIKLDKI